MSDDGSDAEMADTMAERGGANRVKLWILLEANRWAVAAVVVVVTFAILVALGSLDPNPLVATMANSDPVETLFQALTTAIVTGVTLVVSINSLVLSQELGALGDQRDRMEGAMAFRRDLADHLDRPVSPVEPSAFLAAIVDASHEQAEALQAAVETNADGGDAVDDSARTELADFADSVVENATNVGSQLDGAQFGTFDVVSAALDYNYSWKLYEARRLRAERGDDLSETARETLDELVETLELFGPAREHVKTLYFQWELVDLSRAMLYVAGPALVVSVGSVLFLNDAGTLPGTTLGVSNLLWAVSAATVVAVLPFVILLAYVLRIATVAKRTLAIGPLMLRETERDGDDVRNAG
ncbi:MAG: hypothetical protein ABEI96_08490 [Haloarculaceae archaeon]